MRLSLFFKIVTQDVLWAFVGGSLLSVALPVSCWRCGLAGVGVWALGIALRRTELA